MSSLLAFVAASLLTSAAVTPKSAASPTVLDPALASALKAPAPALSKERRPVRFASGAEATTCQTYASLRCKSTLQESESNDAAIDDYVICDEIALLQSARAAKIAGPKNRGQVLAQRLDLRTFRSSLKQRLDDRIFVLQKLWRPTPRTDGRQAIAKSADWKFVVAVDALLDIDADGREDWLVSVTDQSTTATYDSRQIVVVRDPAMAGLLKAEPVDKWVCGAR